MSGQTYYVRMRGKILGPFSSGQLRLLQSRGQITRLDEVSEDRQNWVPAPEVQGLFPAAEQPASALVARHDLPARTEQWFFVNEAEQQQGPVSRDQLLEMYRLGTVHESTPIWTRGMQEWQPLAQVLGVADTSRWSRGGHRSPTEASYELSVDRGPPGIAVAGMVLGIVGFVCSFMPCFGWVFGVILGVLGVIFSAVGLAQATRQGKGMAVTGLVLSLLAIISGPVFYVLILAAYLRHL
jgi:GYF domain 2